ncbi:ketopantoate reductase family protein [Paradesertivirga mongoliensis]|uniref:2-dehydropantoate 2-reductase n=1 Tax=Paradesertivirga mongoliensis TaxID=2100740 RepID=A0ABW4ZKX0_9SPHI|nr:2-dehydropantoate 2-reductase N-terminal domain-containing protein [Pedobacter mongoliensis]
MKILILGAGAVGGYFGALLQDKGIHVTLLVREERAIHLRQNGLKVRSPLGDFTVYPEVITSLKFTDVFQLVIISCKSYALDDAVKLLSTLQRSTYILPLLNGISHYPKLVNQFGKNFVLGGFAHLSTVLDSNGNILHLNDLQVLTVGALLPQQESFLRFARNVLFKDAPFISYSDNIQMDIWKKLIFISTAASATCLVGDTMGNIASTPQGARQIKKAFEISCKTAAFHGFAPDNIWKRKTLQGLLDPESTMTSSLLRDMQYNNPAEISILRDMLEKTKEAGLYNELLEAGYLAVEMYEENRKHTQIGKPLKHC